MAKSTEEIQAGWTGYVRPQDGQVYQHYKGGKYEIVATGFFEDSLVPCVVYRTVEKGIVWVRSAADFSETVEVGGVSRPRFAAM